MHTFATGLDLHAQVYSYQVQAWTGQQVKAVATAAMAGCIDRLLTVDLTALTAHLAWQPSADHGECADGDVGSAELVGDPL